MAVRDDLDVNSTPADWLRSDARFCERFANGEVQTIASYGLELQQVAHHYNYSANFSNGLMRKKDLLKQVFNLCC